FYTTASVLRISAQPAPGYRFLAWTAGEGGVTIQGVNMLGTSANPSVFPIDRGTLFYTAVFTQAPTTLVTSQPEGQLITVDGVDVLTPRAFIWAPGSAHTLHAAPSRTGWVGSVRNNFQRWSTGETGDLTVTAGVESATITATF